MDAKCEGGLGDYGFVTHKGLSIEQMCRRPFSRIAG